MMKLLKLFSWRARWRRREERERMIQYLCHMIADAEQQLKSGEQRVKVKDLAHYAQKILDFK